MSKGWLGWIRKWAILNYCRRTGHPFIFGDSYKPLALSRLVLPLTHLLWQPKEDTKLRKWAPPPTQQLWPSMLTKTAYLTKHWTKLQGRLQDEFCIYQHCFCIYIYMLSYRTWILCFILHPIPSNVPYRNNSRCHIHVYCIISHSSMRT